MQPSGGGLAEQYSRSNGVPVSAVDLTWSYAAALTAFGARAGVMSPGWGAAGLTVPTTCQTSGSGGGGGGSTGTVAVTFNVVATTVIGGSCWPFPNIAQLYSNFTAAEDIYITGSVPSLQNWSPDTALILNPDNYPTWSSMCSSSPRTIKCLTTAVTVNVPASSDIQYKYIRKFNGVLTSWESDPNNDFQSPSGGSLTRNGSFSSSFGDGISNELNCTDVWR